MDDSRLDKVLSGIYYDLNQPASFTSAERLFREARKAVPSLTRSGVREWLRSQKVYTLHRPKRRNFLRNHVVATTVDELWQADLVDMQAFKRVNQGYAYILTMVDVLSKFAFAVPVKTKHGKVIADALESVFAKRYPSNLQTDQGKEFLNSEVKQVIEKYSINFYTSKDEDIKCSLVERFNRTLRGRMFRYFTHKGSHKYLDVLEKIVDAYNRTEHSATGMKPIEVEIGDDSRLFKQLYGYENKRQMMMASRSSERDTAPVGSTVRIKYQENLMDKGYYPTWTDEVFTVANTIKDTHNKEMYILKDCDGEVIEGRFYPEEIQVIRDDNYRIKILRSRTRKGVVEHLVHWIGYPSSKDSWIQDSDLVSNDGLSLSDSLSQEA